MKRVVITGIGPVSAIGIGREAFFAGLSECRSGIRQVASFGTAGYRSKLAAQVAGFDVADYLESQKNYLDRASELAFAAISLALEDADLDPKTLDGAQTGLLLGSAYGNLATAGLFFADYLQKGPRFVKPVLFPHTYSNTTISLLAIEYNLRGYHANFASGSASAGCAIVEAFDLVRQGRTSLVFAGGFEAFSEILFSGLNLSGALSPCDGGEERCSPFAGSRNGFILGEGAGILVIEELDHALARGARLYGEITGAGVTGGMRIGDAMNLALKGESTGTEGVDLILANANGSPELDGMEAEAIEALLGCSSEITQAGVLEGRPPCRPKTRTRRSPSLHNAATKELRVSNLGGASGVAVSSIKPMVGETLGAAGALQLAAALGAIETGFIPPVPDCESATDGIARSIVAGSGLRKRVGRVLLNSIDGGGSVVSLAVRGGGR